MLEPSVIDLIYDRTQADVDRLKELSQKGWDNLTPYEKHEYLYGAYSAPIAWKDGELLEFSDSGTVKLYGIMWSDLDPVTLLDGALELYNDELTNKGAYNAADLNRVESMVQTIAKELYDLGYIVVVAPPKNWSKEDIPQETEMQAYLDQVQTIRNSIGVMPTTPTVPTDMDGLTYQEANDIEKILSDVHFLLGKIGLNWFYAGEIYAGEV